MGKYNDPDYWKNLVNEERLTNTVEPCECKAPPTVTQLAQDLNQNLLEMKDVTTNIYGIYGGFIPISTLIEQCIGINVESVGIESADDAGLRIVGTLVPRSPRGYMKACIHDKYRQYKNLDNFGSTYNPSYGRYKKIIINPPATIVIWNDGTKTVVKATENDIYDPEKGVALCFLKKYFGSLYKHILKDANDIYEKKMEENAELNNSLNGASLLKGFTVSLTEITNEAIKRILGDEKEDGGDK